MPMAVPELLKSASMSDRHNVQMMYLFLPPFPNGDDNNDVLMVRSNYITEMELIIYNRWGQEVFFY